VLFHVPRKGLDDIAADLAVGPMDIYSGKTSVVSGWPTIRPESDGPVLHSAKGKDSHNFVAAQ
jgi:hypothetical protein